MDQGRPTVDGGSSGSPMLALSLQGMVDTAKKNFGGGNTAWEEKSLSKYEFRWVPVPVLCCRLSPVGTVTHVADTEGPCSTATCPLSWD